VRSTGFSQSMRVVLNHAMLALAVSLGRRTGLFETMARLPPATGERIAGAAGLDERYVREWLAAMVTGRIVDYDRARGTYRLPAEHAAVLTEGAGSADMALAMQSVPALARVEAQVADCFRSGAGLPVDRFQEWRSLRAEEIARNQQALLIDDVLPLVPGLVERLRAGVDVFEVGCAGRAGDLMRQAFPASRLVAGDVSSLEPTSEAFDLVTAFDLMHEHPQPARLLAAVQAGLRPGGTFLCMEMAGSSDLADNIDHPLGPLVYTISTLYSLPVSRAAGGLGPGVMWGEEEARRMIASAGLRDVVARRIDNDAAHVYYVATKPL
jgi:SAM-dependent methyltransferase